MITHRLSDYTLTETDQKSWFVFAYRGFSRVAHIDDMYITLAQLNADVAAQRDFPKPVIFKSEAEIEKEKAEKRQANIANGLLRKENAKKEKSEIENS